MARFEASRIYVLEELIIQPLRTSTRWNGMEVTFSIHLPPTTLPCAEAANHLSASGLLQELATANIAVGHTHLPQSTPAFTQSTISCGSRIRLLPPSSHSTYVSGRANPM